MEQELTEGKIMNTKQEHEVCGIDPDGALLACHAVVVPPTPGHEVCGIETGVPSLDSLPIIGRFESNDR